MEYNEDFLKRMINVPPNYPIKLNVGCGTDHRENYIGIDRAKFDEHVDIIMDIEKELLPFDNNSVDEIYCAHVLEHLFSPELLIAEFYRVLKPGALLHIVVPHYSHPNAKQPIHKNYWGIYTKQIFDGQYHEFEDWSKSEWDVNFANRTGLKQKLLKPFIKRYPSIYEGHFAAIMPIAELQFKLIK